MTAHELLVAGRNRLARGHLVKRALCDGDGGYCAQGALFGGGYERYQELVALRGTPEYEPWGAAQSALVDAVGSGESGTRVVDFNNRPETTKADVLALFDRAIAATAPEPDTNLVTPEPVTA